MGLILAGLSAASTTLGDQWKEFFYCEAMPSDLLVTKGVKRVGGRSSNRFGSDNIITNGSGIAVADGQCMIIVEQGAIVEVCSEPGEYTFDQSTEPSIFCGNLSQGIRNTFETFKKRFTMGGDSGKDQRVYYFNTKEITDNKFGTPNPVPFRVVDNKIGLDIDVSIRCAGIYSYRIADPLLFYKNVCGNVAQSYTRDELDRQLKTEFVSALQPAFGVLSNMEIRPNQIVTHNAEIEAAMNDQLSQKWGELRGLQVVSVAMSTVTLPEEDAELIKTAQRAAINRDPSMAAATLTAAQADAMKGAANNAGGAMNGFIGMNMAQQAGGINTNQLFQMGQEKQQQAAAAAAAQPQIPANGPAAAGAWTCSCGAENTGKFCPNCGNPKPEETKWTCSCGSENTGKFCPNCGSPKPASTEWTCECGTVNNGKFCSNCGKQAQN